MATYDPQLVSLVWGAIQMSGYAEGSMIAATMTGDKNKVQVGSAGATCFAKTANRAGEVTFRLFETSPLNAALSAAYDAGNVEVPMTLASLSTGAKMHGGNAILADKPGTTYDNNVPVREWKLIVDNMDSQFA